MSRVSGILISRPSKAVHGEMPIAPAVLDLRLESEVLRAQVEQTLVAWLEAERAEYLRQPVFACLYSDLTDFVLRPGKRLRPLLFLFGYRIFQNGSPGSNLRPSEENLRQIAASLELLHAFMLIHDDIIDRAETRRGMPSLHRLIEGRISSFSDRHRAGRNLALVLGDVLFALAQKCLLGASLPPDIGSRLGTLLLGSMVETGFGEAADIIHGTRDVSKVSLDEIEQMYCLKTTCYTIEGPLAMAAVLAGGDGPMLEAIGRIAKPAGLAFQMHNDLQEFARFELSDADIPADILEGKKTLLIRTAYERLNDTDRGLLQLCFSAGTPTEGTVSKARELVVKSGAVGELTAKVDRLFAEARAETCWQGFSPAVQTGLASLLQLIWGNANRV